MAAARVLRMCLRRRLSTVPAQAPSTAPSAAAPGERRGRLRSALWLGIKVGCLVHVFSDHVATLIMCTGPSMLPTLSAHGDVVVIDRVSARRGHITKGDVVVAISPRNPSVTVCKRIVGDEGDRICVNPTEYPRTFLTVPRNHVFLLGDNLDNSTDSRAYGFVSKALITGRVVYKVWPFRHAGRVANYYDESDWPVEPEEGVLIAGTTPAEGIDAPTTVVIAPHRRGEDQTDADGPVQTTPPLSNNSAMDMSVVDSQERIAAVGEAETAALATTEGAITAVGSEKMPTDEPTSNTERDMAPAMAAGDLPLVVNNADVPSTVANASSMVADPLQTIEPTSLVGTLLSVEPSSGRSALPALEDVGSQAAQLPPLVHVMDTPQAAGTEPVSLLPQLTDATGGSLCDRPPLSPQDVR